MKWIRDVGLGLALLCPGVLQAGDLSDAYDAYGKGQYEEAAKNFQKYNQKQPLDFDQLYNSGVALYRKGDYAEASNYFDRAKQSTDPAMKSRAAYNKGVAMGRMGRWDQAETEFQEALSYDNDNKMIQDNLQQASELKKFQKKQQGQDGNQQQAGQQQNNQQQQNSQQQQAGQQQQQQAQNGQQQQAGQPSGDALQKDPQGDKHIHEPTKDGVNPGQQQQAQNGDSQGSQKDPNGKDGFAKDKDGQDKMLDDKGKDGFAKDKDGKDRMRDEKGQGSGYAQHKDGKDKQAEQGSSFVPQPKKDGKNPEGTMQLADPQGNSQSPGDGQGKVLTVKDLKKQEAEKILRSVEDRIGTYVLTPEQANTEGKSRNGKDW